MLTKIFWKKTWIWLKHYWYFPVIIALLIFSAISGRSSMNKIFGLFTKQKESYEKEIQIVKEASEKASKEKSTVIEEYGKEVKKIEQDHDVRIEDLEEEKQKELEVTIKNNKNNPDKLAEQVAKILSATLHKKNR